MTGGITITADGFTSNSFASPTALFLKNGGGDEVGIGLVDDPSGQHEITGNNVIRIDFTNAVSAGVTNFDFQFNSSTAGETWAVFGSNSATSGFVSVATGSDELVPYDRWRTV
jgi:hypothetical protein